MKRLHLICNAHLDPYWQWDWEEGAAETLSTFRTAVEICEQHDTFVFNHNEAILYQWIEEYEPALFDRIARLVREGRWHIMGGWYLQPDCNMLSGESFVRQILLGKGYFLDRFGVEPTVAINFDPFGHTRGLVQILAKTGYQGYLFCRPASYFVEIPAEDFTWVGCDGSRIMGRREAVGYNSRRGQAVEKIENILKSRAEANVDLVLWGIGDHGGGPSRVDMQRVNELISKRDDVEIVHSTPEDYFRERIEEEDEAAPEVDYSLNPWAIGCYTSMVRVKQKHRELENSLYMAEKMAATAAAQGLMAYPVGDLVEASRDLATAQFHDILPGSSVQAVEESALRLLYHGSEIVSRIRARAFFALCSGQPKPGEGEIPVMAYNPHPWPVRGCFSCEYQLEDAIFEEQFTVGTVYRDDEALPTQMEKEASNLPIDWRKRVVFEAELAPSSVSRFNCRLEVKTERPKPLVSFENGVLEHRTDRLRVAINEKSGLINAMDVDGKPCLGLRAGEGVVMVDNSDPWRMDAVSWDEEEGRLELVSPEEAAWVCGLEKTELAPVRVIEDGPVRTVVESIFRYGRSFMIQRYGLPKSGAEIEVEVRVFWNEKDRLLKWSLPVAFDNPEYCGQHAFCVEPSSTDGKEFVAQRWTAVRSADGENALTCINDGVYGSDFRDGALRMTLLRSPGYCAHPLLERPTLMPDRFTPRIDQGERLYRFWLQGGTAKERFERIDREAAEHNEAPFLLSFQPSGQGAVPQPGPIFEDDVCQMTAFKCAQNGSGYVVRVFEPTGRARTTRMRVPVLNVDTELQLNAFEAKTLLISDSGQVVETDMLERPLP